MHPPPEPWRLRAPATGRLASRLLPAILAIIPGAPARAETPPPPDYASRLLGDAQGWRSDLYQHGPDPEIGYQADLVSKLTGGPNRLKPYALDNLDIKLHLAGDKLFGWENTRGLLYILGNHGGKPALKNDRPPHGLDNIEVPDGADTI